MLDFELLRKAIEEHDIITIFGHAMPDGDCYGSQMALRELIRDNYPNKKVYAIGSGLPRFRKVIGNMDHVGKDTIAKSLAIIVDVSCLRRVEDPRVRLAHSFFKIDHHHPNNDIEPFEGPMLLDPERIAAAEIIADYAFEEKLYVSRRTAEALYLGICTDSGRFRYHGTTIWTMRLIDRLCALGVRKGLLEHLAYYVPVRIRRFREAICAKAKMSGDVSYVYVAREDLEEYHVTLEEAIHSTNSLAGVAQKAHAYILFVESDPGKVRVEFRSNQGYPVLGVARKFQGGGHVFAAGAEIETEKDTYQDVLDEMNKVEKDENAGV